MVINKVKELLSRNDEKYEVLYYKYSQLKLENKKLQEKHQGHITDTKESHKKTAAKHLIGLFQAIEDAKNASFQIKATDKDIQRLLIEINKVEKRAKEVLREYSVEEYSAPERMYDPEIHDVASYMDAKGMQKGIIMNTVKRGFKYKNEIIIKPKVVVTK